MRYARKLFVGSLVSLAPALAHGQIGTGGPADWMTLAKLGQLGGIVYILGALGLICGLIGLIMSVTDRSRGLAKAQGYVIAFVLLLPAYVFMLIGVVWFLIPMAQVVLLVLYLGVRRTRLAGAGAKTTPGAPTAVK